METCLAKSKDINLVYTINEPAAVGASRGPGRRRGEGATIVSVDGGCDPGISSVKSGVIGATSQQYPLKMAELGVETIAKMVRGEVKPPNQPRPGLLSTPASPLVTDKPVDGVESIDHHRGRRDLLGQEVADGPCGWLARHRRSQTGGPPVRS